MLNQEPIVFRIGIICVFKGDPHFTSCYSLLREYGISVKYFIATEYHNTF